MILPDLVLPSRQNQRWQYSGIDSPDHCFNLGYFKTYPYPISYSYNSRGFRDLEWPDAMSDLQQAIWCVGDSFTVGIGQPFDHIWPQVLSKFTGYRTINVSMDGASNDWIYRRTLQILHEIDPVLIVVMWSYTHRREHADSLLSDEQRRIHSSRQIAAEDFRHWNRLANHLDTYAHKIIQCTIPEFCLVKNLIDTWNIIKDPGWPQKLENAQDFYALDDQVKFELQIQHRCYDRFEQFFRDHDLAFSLSEWQCPKDIIHVTSRLDWARDYHHFDILTGQWLIQHVLKQIDRKDLARNFLRLGFVDRSSSA